jgi:hypothetical protein
LVKVGFAAVGVASAFGAPPLAVIGAGIATAAVAGAVIHGLQSHIEEITPPSDKDGQPAPEGTATSPRSELTDKELGIRAEYQKERPADREILRRFRIAVPNLVARLAALADRDVTDVVLGNAAEALSKVLAATRAEAANAEVTYAAWLASKVTTQSTLVDQRVPVSRIPTKDRLLEELKNVDDLQIGPRAKKALWWEPASQLHTMISIDYLDGDGAPRVSPVVSKADDGTVVTRLPRSAMLSTWKIRPKGSKEWTAELERSDRVLITAVGSEISLPIAVGHKPTRSVQVTLDPSGALIKVDASGKSASADRADILGAIPGDVSSALTAGSALGKAISPREIELAKLTSEGSIAAAKAKLAPAVSNPLIDSLTDQVQEAELEARLAQAQQIRDHPSSIAIVINRSEND